MFVVQLVSWKRGLFGLFVYDRLRRLRDLLGFRGDHGLDARIRLLGLLFYRLCRLLFGGFPYKGLPDIHQFLIYLVDSFQKMAVFAIRHPGPLL